jgi:hypothetical protein
MVSDRFSDYGLLESETLDIRVNMYGLGGSKVGYGKKANMVFSDRRKAKLDDIIETYTGIWTTLLSSEKEVKDRQSLISRLVYDVPYSQTVGIAAQAVNRILEPYMHLANMASLISANTLHSRLGSRISRPQFYSDFMAISSEFVERYEEASSLIAKLDADSREMGAMVIPLRQLFSEQGDLYGTYDFLNRLLMARPKDFTELAEFFRKELKKCNATLFPELEAEKPDNKDRWPDPEQEKLIRKFHAQNPVTKSEYMFSLLDSIGTRLAAFYYVGQYFQGKECVMPSILSEEVGIINIKNGWYPLTKLQHTKEPVRNSVLMDMDRRIQVIEGPNISGKTIYTRSVLFSVACAMAGLPVFAEDAEISYFSRIRFRIKDTGMGDSGALVKDLQNIAYILKDLGSSSSIFIGIDEAYTSTNAVEGDPLAYGTLRMLSEHPQVRAIFTSHFPELSDILDDPLVSGVFFSHFDYEAKEGKLVFPHIIRQGPNTTEDYAIPIASHEEIPAIIIQGAKEYLENQK